MAETQITVSRNDLVPLLVGGIIVYLILKATGILDGLGGAGSGAGSTGMGGLLTGGAGAVGGAGGTGGPGSAACDCCQPSLPAPAFVETPGDINVASGVNITRHFEIIDPNMVAPTVSYYG